MIYQIQFALLITEFKSDCSGFLIPEFLNQATAETKNTIAIQISN